MILTKNYRGITLIELLITLTIISVLSMTAFLSLSGSRTGITLDAVAEILEDTLTLIKTDTLTDTMSFGSVSFSLSTPLSFLLSETVNNASARSVTAGNTLSLISLTEPSHGSNGIVSITWNNPQNSDTLNIRSSKQLSTKTYPADALPISFSPLNVFQNYKLELTNAVSHVTVGSITLSYFSSENTNPESSNKIILSRIEVLDFSNTWIPVSSAEIRYIAPFGTKKVFSDNKEYTNIRITLKSGSDTVIHTFL